MNKNKKVVDIFRKSGKIYKTDAKENGRIPWNSSL